MLTPPSIPVRESADRRQDLAVMAVFEAAFELLRDIEVPRVTMPRLR